MSHSTFRCVGAALFTLLFIMAIPAWSNPVQASLSVVPERPTNADEVKVQIDLTSDSLDPCDYEVRLLASYGGLTGFEQEVAGNTIRLHGSLFPHLIPPVEVVPCDVPCIEVQQPPHAVYAVIDLGRMNPGAHRVEVFLPELCGMQTPCDVAPVLECAFELPLELTFAVEGTADVDPRNGLAVIWAALKEAYSGR